jgi:branched-chain amino acid transport system permease protein
MGLCATLGISIERFAYRPVRRAPRLTPLITAIGVSMFLQNLAQVVFGPNPHSFPQMIRQHTYHLGPVTTSNHTLLILGVGVVLLVGLHLFVSRTWTGKAMRAIAFNLDAARLMGIPTDRIIMMTFLVGSSLAAAAGVLVGLREGQIRPLMGNIYGLKAFVAAVLGGIGNIPGAMLGGLLIGLVEVIVSGLPRIGPFDPSQFRDAVTFLVLIGVLIVKPTGLLGVVRAEKV